VAPGATFERLAHDLYGRPRGEFTGARDALAREVRAAGDVDVATRLRSLRKPTAAAWLANMVVRAHPAELARLVEVGSDLRMAQARFDGGALRRLSEERRAAVEALSDDARRLAAVHGETASDATVRELEATLEAASLDAAAASELRAGRLTSALAYSGMGFLEAAGVPPTTRAPTVGGRPGADDARSRASARRTGGSTDGGSTDGTSTDSASTDGTSTDGGSASSRARREARDARRVAGKAAAQLGSAERAADRARAAVRVAEAELARRRDALHDAERAVERARSEMGAAEHAAARAERTVATSPIRP